MRKLNQRFCHIFKRKFYDFDNRNDSNDSNNDSNDKEFDPIKLHGDGEIHDVNNDHSDEKFDAIKFHEMVMRMIFMMRNLIP